MMSPLSWYGGKYLLSKKIIRYLPPSIESYIEVFGGGGSLLFAKRPSLFECYNDVYSDVVNFFRVVRDENKCKELVRLVTLTPYSREEYGYCRDNKDKFITDIEKGHRFVICNQMSFGSKENGSFSSSGSKSWHNMPNRLYKACMRLKNVMIENDTFERVITRYKDNPKTLFYCDPPYLPETRKSKKIYQHEMTYEDHVKFLDIVLDINAHIIVSGYRSELYFEKLKDWKYLEFEMKTSVNDPSKEQAKRTEIVWFNNKFNIYNKVGKYW